MMDCTSRLTLCLAGILFANAAHGQTPAGDPAAPPVQAPTAPEPVKAPANPFQRYDDLTLKGWIIPNPRIGDTILQDKLGIRPALADLGIGIFVASVNGFIYNVLEDRSTDRVAYNGQRSPTYNIGVQSLTLTYDAGRLGIPDGQIITRVAATTNAIERLNNPRDLRVSNLAYYQELFDDLIAFKVGIFDNQQEFVGSSVGGSFVAGSLGPRAAIPIQVGLSYNIFGTPSANLRINPNDRSYFKIGVQRSIPAGGAEDEVAANRSGLGFSAPGAKALYIGEAGYRIEAAPGRKSLWLRAGGIRNTTRYFDFETGGTGKNWAMYVGVDKQLTQTDPKLPFRGLYAGASFNAAPDNVNLFTRYYEARTYGIGLFEGRPFDLTSLVFTYNGLSRPAGRVIAAGGAAENHIITVTGSNAFRLRNGIYVQPGLGYTINPVVAPRLADALNAYLTVSLLF